jgi:hydrogenase expression/formation protein HypD
MPGQIIEMLPERPHLATVDVSRVRRSVNSIMLADEAVQPEMILTTFGDMMRVPGGRGSFLDATARGADIRMVYSLLDALQIAARQNPDKQVVFMAIGLRPPRRRQP